MRTSINHISNSVQPQFKNCWSADSYGSGGISWW